MFVFERMFGYPLGSGGVFRDLVNPAERGPAVRAGKVFAGSWFFC
jgi:hypothetical protein